VLSKRVRVQVLSRCAVEVQRGVDHSEVQGSSWLLSFTSVELDCGAGDRVVTKPVSSLVVEIVEVRDVRLFLDHEIHTGDRVIKHHSGVRFGGGRGLDVEVRDLVVSDEVFMGVRGEEASFHGVEEDEVGQQTSILDFSVKSGAKTSIACVGEDHEFVLASEFELDTNVMVLQGNHGESLGSGAREPEGQLHVQLDTRVSIGIDGVSVVRPVDQLSLARGPEGQLIYVNIHVRLKLVLEFQVLTCHLVDFVVTNLHRSGLEGGVAQTVGPMDGVASSGSQVEQLHVHDQVHLGDQITITRHLDHR